MTKLLSAFGAILVALALAPVPAPSSSSGAGTAAAAPYPVFRTPTTKRDPEPVTRSLVRQPAPVKPKPVKKKAARQAYAPVVAVGAVKQYALRIFGPTQYACANTIFIAESHWQPTAQSKISTAYGIAQFLDRTWKNVGIAKTSDPFTQVRAAKIYMDGTFGSACQALTYRQAHGYY